MAGTFHPEERVAALSSTAGSGNLTLTATTPKGFVSFAAAGYVVGDLFDGEIVAPDGTGWESSLCLLFSTTVVQRIRVYANSLGTTAFIVFNNSTKTIFVNFPAAKIKATYANNFTSGAYV